MSTNPNSFISFCRSSGRLLSLTSHRSSYHCARNDATRPLPFLQSVDAHRKKIKERRSTIRKGRKRVPVLTKKNVKVIFIRKINHKLIIILKLAMVVAKKQVVCIQNFLFLECSAIFIYKYSFFSSLQLSPKYIFFSLTVNIIFYIFKWIKIH